MKQNYLFSLLTVMLLITATFNNAKAINELSQTELVPAMTNVDVKSNQTSPTINEFCSSNDTLWTDENGEYADYIEIYNPGPDTIDLGGWYITDDLSNPTEYMIPTGNDSTIMNPGEFLILVADKQPEKGVLHVNIKLSGDGEAIGITNDPLVYVDSLTYGDATGAWIPSPGTNNSAGLSKEGGDTWVVYEFGKDPAPSPGVPNNLPTLYINEFCSSNDTLWADEHGEYEDYIEIYNPNSEPIDIAGWYITDDLTDGQVWQIPEGNDSTIIAAEGFLLLVADKSPDQGVLHIKIKLSGDGEAIGLSRDGYNYVDSLTYGDAAGAWIPSPGTDNSAGLSTDGGDTWVVFLFEGNPKPTPGYSNTDQGIAINTTKENLSCINSYPNPFVGSTTIEFSLEQNEMVNIQVYNITGKIVGTIATGEYNAGTHNVTWDASNLNSGMYFVQLTSGSSQTVHKAIIR